ncbi:hypothetical protein PS6_007118 [Mucor atramentarius]
MSTIQLKFLPDAFSVHQYDRNFQISHDVLSAPWFTISKTASELSLILPTEYQLPDPQPKQTEPGWRMFQVDAQMDFGLVAPLKDHKIPVFVVSTYDTDYIMVKDDKLTEAIKVLNGEPNMVVKPGESVL